MSDALAIGLVMGVILLYVIIIGLGIASYIIGSLSLYTMAKHRQISKPWLSWIPLANNWIIGSIADSLDEEHGFSRKWRVVLLTLSVIVVALVVVLYAVMFTYLIFVISLSEGAPIEGEMVMPIIAMYVVMIPFSLLAVTLSYLQMICVYKIFETAQPEKVIKYLLLSLLVPLAYSICLMKCKDKIKLKHIPVAIDEPNVEEI